MRRIGLFDSGVGGLTVAKDLLRAFPYLDVCYFGDTARLPYGNKSPKIIITYSLEIADFLGSMNIDMIVVACNTSSSIALNALKEKFSIPIVGMIAPGAQLAVETTKSGKIGLIGTRATVSSGSYEKEILRLNKDAKVFSQACPLFVPLVEEGFSEGPVAELVAEKYLADLIKQNIDTLILGCTHYPILIPVLKKIAPKIAFISSGEATVRHLERNLELKVETDRKKGNLEVYVTDGGTHFKEVAEKLLGREIFLQEVSLERLGTR